ncbi:MAG: hypothetical protein ACXWXR_10740 [Candidatus Limnocylindrales bacterium]
MPAYVAMARISGPQPRLRATSPSKTTEPARPDADMVDRVVAVDLVGRSFDDRLADWWDDLTQNLSQTTFFLLDPESWR